MLIFILLPSHMRLSPGITLTVSQTSCIWRHIYNCSGNLNSRNGNHIAKVLPLDNLEGLPSHMLYNPNLCMCLNKCTLTKLTIKPLNYLASISEKKFLCLVSYCNSLIHIAKMNKNLQDCLILRKVYIRSTCSPL